MDWHRSAYARTGPAGILFSLQVPRGLCTAFAAVRRALRFLAKRAFAAANPHVSGSTVPLAQAELLDMRQVVLIAKRPPDDVGSTARSVLTARAGTVVDAGAMCDRLALAWARIDFRRSAHCSLP